MTLLTVIVLAIIQGITEFLPVSSSGHLALAGTVMNVPAGDITFEVVVHVGTLLAVLAVYWKDLVSLVSGVFRKQKESLVLAGLLALGSLPAAVAGFLLADSVEQLFDKPVVISIMLIVTGCALFSTRLPPAKRGKRENPSITGSLMIGLAQAVALLPGISRSGFTISTGLFAGIKKEKAARFSFLLSIPAIAGAAALKLGDIGESSIELPLIIVGLVVSAVTGYLALRLLLSFLSKGKFSIFSWYCWALGLSGLVISIITGG